MWYKEEVRKETEKNFKKYFVDNKQLRGTNFHLDHKCSIKDCYDNKVPTEIAGHTVNLEVISKKDNLSKGSNSKITSQELLEQFIEHESFFSPDDDY